MSLIFDPQTHPNGGVIFDLQDYSPGFGTTTVTVTPQATTGVGRFLDTDLQVVIYPQGEMVYAPPGQSYTVNGSVQAFLTPGASLSYTPFSASYGVFGNVITGLIPVGSVTYLPASGIYVDGFVGVSFTPLGSITYNPALIGSGIPAVIFQMGSQVEKKRRKKFVDEGTSAVLTLRCYDRGGVAVAPLNVTYQVDCSTTGTAVRTATALPSTPQIELTLTGVDNAIVDAGNVRELRRVTVEATLPGGDTVNAQYDYLVRNLSGVV